MQELRIELVALSALVGVAALGCSGSDGPSGPAGAPGAAGASGVNGAQGAPGATGQPGAAGQPGAQGPQGLPGAQGDAGAAGDSGATGPGSAPRVVWKDRNGAVVPVVAYDISSNDGPLVLDSNGYVWRVNAWSGAVKEAFVFTSYAYYASNDCSGPAILDFSIPPNYVFTLTDDLSGTYRRVPNAPPAVGTAYQSSKSGGGNCQVGAGATIFSGASYASTAPPTPITKPASLFAPPLHAEFVN